MLIAIIGENCVGKSTLANKINETLNAKIYSGKDYLRLEKNPSMALEKFKTILKEAVIGDSIIYLITEKEHLSLLPEGAFKIVLTAELEVIKERFKERMRGNLPLPLEKMLEAKHGMYDNLKCDLRLDSNYNIEEVVNSLK
jgi:cytidylate kinase